MNFLLIGIFGSLGVWLRFLINKLNDKAPFGLDGNFFANILGCFILGLLFKHYNNQSAPAIILGIGLCGGLTTFSSYVMKSFHLLTQNQYLQASLYTLLSIVFGHLFFMLGHKINA